MINRKYNCENKVNSRKLGVLKKQHLLEKKLLGKRITALKKAGVLKSRGSEKTVQSKSSFIIN